MKIASLMLISFLLLGCSEIARNVAGPEQEKQEKAALLFNDGDDNDEDEEEEAEAEAEAEAEVDADVDDEDGSPEAVASPAPPPVAQLEPTSRQEINHNNRNIHTYNDVAHKLAGFNANNPEYSAFITTRWEKLCSESLGAIEAWSEKNVIPHIGEVSTVFYPFGGPDIACPFKFFPEADTYILVGLEPIGCFQELERNVDRPEMQESLKNAFLWYLQKGFFVTSEMSRKLSSKFLRGTICLMLPQLALLNFCIDNLEDISIDGAGAEVPRGSGMLDGVKITCSRKADGAQKVIYYIRANLANHHAKLSNLTKFMESRTFATFIKSASYALHDSALSNFKRFLLDHSTAIFQDDTGIPFNDFGEGKKWEKHGFGMYTEPVLRIFKNYKQPSMLNFFKSGNIVNIPFKIGYGFHQGRPNFLLAVRRHHAPIADNEHAVTTKAASSSAVPAPAPAPAPAPSPPASASVPKQRQAPSQADKNSSDDRVVSLQLEMHKLFGSEWPIALNEDDNGAMMSENLLNTLLLAPSDYDNASTIDP
ncbi:MAG: hypothetical protein LBJ16_02455 [Holosporaceae bacterium]|jgi:hypothetical protein|nr:hypothetical protein [Holosporaceae bacterium]